jgi:hypothetical protein
VDLERLITQMEHNAQAIRDLVHDISDQQARWSPAPDAWSVLDVMNHMAYEEEHDFRARLNLALHHPQEAWPRGDPARGVTERSRQQTLEQATARFLAAREDALAWLASLETADWDTACEAPFGEIRAGDIMAAWAAHDLLHLRQLIELRWGVLVGDVGPYSVRYAGEW